MASARNIAWAHLRRPWTLRRRGHRRMPCHRRKQWPFRRRWHRLRAGHGTGGNLASVEDAASAQATASAAAMASAQATASAQAMGSGQASRSAQTDKIGWGHGIGGGHGIGAGHGGQPSGVVPRAEDGFRFKGGMDHCTEGIWVWSEPFVRQVDGEPVALVLMDTQGAWDGNMTKEQSATIFGRPVCSAARVVVALGPALVRCDAEYAARPSIAPEPILRSVFDAGRPSSTSPTCGRSRTYFWGPNPGARALRSEPGKGSNDDEPIKRFLGVLHAAEHHIV